LHQKSRLPKFIVKEAQFELEVLCGNKNFQTHKKKERFDKSVKLQQQNLPNTKNGKKSKIFVLPCLVHFFLFTRWRKINFNKSI